MQVKHIGYGIRGFYQIAALGHLWGMTPKDAQRRFDILKFWDKHGLEATRDAFGVSQRTLFRWKKVFRRPATIRPHLPSAPSDPNASAPPRPTRG